MGYNRNFKGIWIPKAIWLSKELTLQEKVLISEIDSLDNPEKGGCFAGNKHFAELFNLSTSRVSDIIKSLVAKQMITRDIIKKQTGSIRYLKISHYLKTRIAQSQNLDVRTSQKQVPHSAESDNRIIQDNNTSKLKGKSKNKRGEAL